MDRDIALRLIPALTTIKERLILIAENTIPQNPGSNSSNSLSAIAPAVINEISDQPTVLDESVNK